MKHFLSFYYPNAVNIILLFISNWVFIQTQFRSVEDTKIFYASILYLIASFIIFSIITSINKLIFLVINALLYITTGLISYFALYYKILISPILIQSILNTDSNEVYEIINFSLIIWITFMCIMPCILLFYISRSLKFKIKAFFNILVIGIAFIVISISLLGFNIISLRMINNSLLSFTPYNYIFAFKNYYKLYLNQNKSAIKLSKHFIYKIDENIKKDLNVLLIIGESARADHFQINGYARKTTPNLSKHKQIISFKNAYSNATNTPLGVEAIMKMQGAYDYSSFIDIFNSLGFKSFWISNQGTKYNIINDIATESIFSIFSDDIRASKLGNNYDENLLPLITKNANESKTEASIFVIHTMGSHRLYDLRYPKEFKQFSPTCIKKQLLYSANECTNIEELVNSYDNSILYTDHFISKIIDIFKDKKAIILYISDHGESLGENGVYAHAYPLDKAPKEQIHIPLIFWASEKFLKDKNLKENFDTLKLNENIRVDQANVFHTILDCAGITSESINLNKSLCKAKIKKHH